MENRTGRSGPGDFGGESRAGSSEANCRIAAGAPEEEKLGSSVGRGSEGQRWPLSLPEWDRGCDGSRRER